MATWNCNNCGWVNGSKFSKCAQCGARQLTDDDERILLQLRTEIQQVQTQVDSYNASLAPKWEYLHLTTEGLNKMGGLNVLGDQGWELVAVSTYEEGGTFLLIGPTLYTVKALYLLKRPKASLPQDLGRQLESLEKRLSGLLF
jgi:hypothetical protein